MNRRFRKYIDFREGGEKEETRIRCRKPLSKASRTREELSHISGEASAMILLNLLRPKKAGKDDTIDDPDVELLPGSRRRGPEGHEKRGIPTRETKGQLRGRKGFGHQ